MPGNDEMSELRALLHADKPDLTDIARKLLDWPEEGRAEAQRYAMGVIVQRDLLLPFVKHGFWFQASKGWRHSFQINPNDAVPVEVEITSDVVGLSWAGVTFRSLAVFGDGVD